MSDEASPGGIEVSDDHGEHEGGLNPLLKVGLIVGALGAVVALLLFGSESGNAIDYSVLVDQALAQRSKYEGRTLRVEGDLKRGSIAFREDPCEWRFVLTAGDKEMPVHFPECIVPDTFQDRPGVKIVALGKLNYDQGNFVATEIIPRCPSKYEMKERQANGEAAPHAMPNTFN